MENKKANNKKAAAAVSDERKPRSVSKDSASSRRASKSANKDKKALGASGAKAGKGATAAGGRLPSLRTDLSLLEARPLLLARVPLARAQLVRRELREVNLQNPSHPAKKRVSKI